MNTENPVSTENLITTLEKNAEVQFGIFDKTAASFLAYQEYLKKSGEFEDYAEPFSRAEALTVSIESIFDSLRKAIDSGDTKTVGILQSEIKEKSREFSVKLSILESATGLSVKDGWVVRSDYRENNSEEITLIEKSLQSSAVEGASINTTENSSGYYEAAKKLDDEATMVSAAMEQLPNELKEEGMFDEFRSELASAGFLTRRVRDNLGSISRSSVESLSEDDMQKSIHRIKTDLGAILDIGMKIRTQISIKKSDEETKAKGVEVLKVLDANPDVVKLKVIEKQKLSASIEIENKYTPEKLEQLAQLYKDKNELAFMEDDGHYKRLAKIKEDIKNILESKGYSVKEVEHRMSAVNQITNAFSGLAEKKKLAVGIKAKYIQQIEINSKYKDLLKLVPDLLNVPPEKVEDEVIIENVNEESETDSSITKLLNEAKKYCKDLDTYVYGDSSNNEEESTTIMSLRLVNHLIKVAKESEKDPKVLEVIMLRYLDQIERVVPKLRQEELEKAIATEPIKNRRQKLVLTDIVEPPVLTDIVDLPVLTDIVEPFAVAEPVAPVTPEVVTAAKVLPEAATVAEVITENVPAPENAGYKSKREHWTTKENFKQKEAAYQSAMETFYQDPSLKARARNSIHSVSKLFGFKPELPAVLQQMQNEYKEHRQLYATSLDEMLALRASSFSTTSVDKANALNEAGFPSTAGLKFNKEYQSDSDSTKLAFGRKFILKPSEKMLQLQEREMLSPENKARLARVMQLMKKYKWPLRVGMIVGAGTMAAGAAAAAGAATIGVAAAAGVGGGFKAARIAASVLMGAGGGILAKNATQGKVDTASQNLEVAKSGAVKNFALGNMNALDEVLQSAILKKKQADNIQKVAIGGAAIATGIAGYNASSLAEVPSTPATGLLSDESIARLIDTKPEVLTPDMAVALLVNNATGVLETAANSEVMFPLPEVLAPYESVSGAAGYMKLSDIKFIGSGELDIAHVEEVNKFITNTAKDLVAANPHLSEVKIETALLEKFQNKFGATEWAKEAGISKIDIGSYQDIKNISALDVTPDEEGVGSSASVVEGSTYASTQETIPNNIYEVQKGDTLWGIVKSEYLANSPAFAELSDTQQNAILDKLLQKLDANPDLVKTLGLKSGTDIDLIYAGEKLNMVALHEELEHIVKNQEELSTYTKSAGLSVAPDIAVENVNINVIEKPETVATTITEVGGSGRTYTEAAPYGYSNPVEVAQDLTDAQTPARDASVPETIKAPTFLSLSGNPFELREYQDYLTKKWDSMDTFNNLVNKQALAFENTTYGAFEKNSWFGTDYNSPYTILGEKTMEEIEEFASKPSSEIRSFLSDNGMKYETYLAWIDKIQEMKDMKDDGLQIQPQTKFSNLFAQYFDKVTEPKVNLNIS